MGLGAMARVVLDDESGAVLEKGDVREAVALARLAHPNTVRLIDFGTSEGGCPCASPGRLNLLGLAKKGSPSSWLRSTWRTFRRRSRVVLPRS